MHPLFINQWTKWLREKGWVRPRTNFYVEWFRNKDEFIDNYWISKHTYTLRRSERKCIIMYVKVPSNSKRWRSFKRFYVHSWDILRDMHERWVINLYDNEWTKRKLTQETTPWNILLSRCSKETLSKIEEEFVPDIVRMLKRQWTKTERVSIAEVLLRTYRKKHGKIKHRDSRFPETRWRKKKQVTDNNEWWETQLQDWAKG